MLNRAGPLMRKQLELQRQGLLPPPEPRDPMRSAGGRTAPAPSASRCGAELVAWPRGFVPVLRRVVLDRRNPERLLAETAAGTRVVLVRTPEDDLRGPRLGTLKPVFSEQVRAVCAAYGLTRAEVMSGRRSSYLMAARMECYWLGAVAYGLTLPRIGRFMGGRDHTSVLNGKRRVDSILTAAFGDLTAADKLDLDERARREAIAAAYGARLLP